jgi:hypothetical protein
MANERQLVRSIGGLIIDKGLLCDRTTASMMKSYLNYGMHIFIHDMQINLLIKAKVADCSDIRTKH